MSIHPNSSSAPARWHCRPGSEDGTSEGDLAIVTNTNGDVGEALVEMTDATIDMHGLFVSVANTAPSCGAVSTFCGVTRNHHNGKAVTALSYTAYTAMAMREFKAIVAHIFKAYAEVHRVVIAHRLGDCPVQDISVYIAVASCHRSESLEATAYAINTLKARVPIWKLERYADGTTLSGSALCCQQHGHGGGAKDATDEAAAQGTEAAWKRNAEFTVKSPVAALPSSSSAE